MRWDRHFRQNPEELSILEAMWFKYVNADVAIDFKSFDSITDSPSRTPYFPANWWTPAFDPFDHDTPDVKRDIEVISRDCSVQTYRYLINDSLAEILGVDYLSLVSVGRLPTLSPQDKIATLRLPKRFSRRLV